VTDPSDKSKTLILINHPRRQKREDFEEIQARIQVLAPEIDVEIVQSDQSADELDENVWQRPCFIVSFGIPQVFRPKRGMGYCCRPIPKFEQLEMLSRAGIPVPTSAELVFGEMLDERLWGPLVVLKPTTLGFMSQGTVFLMRTERVAELAERIFPAGHPARDKPVLVQRFVDTGAWPSFHRVLTLFGEALYCRRAYTVEPRPPLDAPDWVLLRAKIATNVESNSRKYPRAIDDPDILELAKRTYAAIPAIPLQGVDIIREAATGRLFVLEINAGGNTWHFSSQHMQQRGSALTHEERTARVAERVSQFGAWDVAARVLVRKTREEAR
jgi:hypothetical protein